MGDTFGATAFPLIDEWLEIQQLKVDGMLKWILRKFPYVLLFSQTLSGWKLDERRTGWIWMNSVVFPPNPPIFVSDGERSDGRGAADPLLPNPSTSQCPGARYLEQGSYERNKGHS